MNKRLVFTISLLTISILFLSQVAWGQQGGGNGGKDPTNDAFELYGDLFVVARNPNGEGIFDRNGCLRPIHAISADPIHEGSVCAFVPLCGDDPTGQACLEEGEDIAAPGGDSTDEVEACDIWDPYPYMPLTEEGENPLFEFLKEVHFGRLAVTRSTEDVIDHGYLEAISRLNSVQLINNPDYIPGTETPEYLPNIKTDPAGRLQYFAADPDTEVLSWFTIDAPLENLGLYQRLINFGTLLPVDYIRVDKDQMYIIESEEPKWSKMILAEELWSLHPCVGVVAVGDDPSGELRCLDSYPDLYCDPYPDPGETPVDCKALLDPTREDILIAASMLAGAADKTGSTDVDMLVNVNTYLGINDLETDSYFPFVNLFAPDYFPDEYFGGRDGVVLLQTYEGTCESLDGYPCFKVTEMEVFESGLVDFVPNLHCTSWDADFFYQQDVFEGPLIERDPNQPDRYYLFNNDNPWTYYYTSDVEDIGPAQQVAQAVSDAQKLIWFVHNWEVPALD